jgi:hypothetical protein
MGETHGPALLQQEKKVLAWGVAIWESVGTTLNGDLAPCIRGNQGLRGELVP